MKLIGVHLKFIPVHLGLTKRKPDSWCLCRLASEQRWGRQEGVNDDMLSSRRASRHGSLEVLLMFRPDMSRHDRRHKWVEAGLRPVKAGLGGHDAGVSGGRRGVENESIPFQNWDEQQCRNRPPSVAIGELTIEQPDPTSRPCLRN